MNRELGGTLVQKNLLTKTAFFAVLLTGTLSGAAWAQQGPPPSMGPNAPTMGHRMSDADRAKMMQLHEQARAAILGALTPANKALLGTVVSELAVAATPDTKAAAARLDSALSPTEKQAITGAADSMHQQMRAMMPSPKPGDMQDKMADGMPTDPGEILLMMSAMNIMSPDGMMHTMPH